MVTHQTFHWERGQSAAPLPPLADLQNTEQLDLLLSSWLERMLGEESMEEALDDLCLLLGYGNRSEHTRRLYATYTAWWEVEGYADADGEFVCLDVTALQHRLVTMPIKQFALIPELAYQVCLLDAEAEGQPRPPTGQEWLRMLALWLDTGAREPFYQQIWRTELPASPPKQPVATDTQATQSSAAQARK